MGLTIAGVDLDNMKDALLNKAQTVAKGLENGRLNTSKIRSYYNSILSITERLKNDPNNESVWVEFYLLKAKANYDKQRGVINSGFANFITNAVDAISKTESVEDLKKFKIFFEAVVGFFPKSTAN